MSVFEWIGNMAKSALDPDKDLRVQQIEVFVTQRIRALGVNFTLASIHLNSDYSKSDLQDALDLIYTKALERVWADNVVTKKEQQQLRFLEQKLELPNEVVASLRLKFAKRAFGLVLSESLVDGILDQREAKHLNHIASQVGHTLSSFTGVFFKAECEDFVEHVLADAKADNQISLEEERHLTWLLENFGLRPEFAAYATNEVAKIKWLQQISNGKLPSIAPPQGVELVGGELVHASCGCNYHQVRNLKSGPQTKIHSGILVVTDRKVLFVSGTKSFRVSYRSIVGHHGNDQYLKILPQGKPEVFLKFSQRDELIYPIFHASLSIANQTKTAKREKRSRHISRDVRQTVWRRYGGRCADCNANEYLEFDHIIPFSKGGSNDEGNIQLLCRKCNNMKSDKI